MATANEALICHAECIQAMMQKESASYCCSDYLAPSYNCYNRTSSSWSDSSDSSSSQMDETWRAKICEWCFKIVDHLNLSREVVSIAMSYLDRYMAALDAESKQFQQAGRHPQQQVTDKVVFRLAAASALHLAVKLYEFHKLEMTCLVQLSRGYFVAEHMVAMEESLLAKLQWRLHPPIPMDFVRELMPFVSSMGMHFGLSSSAEHSVTQLVCFLTELSVCDYYFVTKKPSSVAIAALIISLEAYFKSNENGQAHSMREQNFTGGVGTQFLHVLNNARIEIPEFDKETIGQCCVRLQDMFFAASYGPFQVEDNIRGDLDSKYIHASPTSVLQHPSSY